MLLIAAALCVLVSCDNTCKVLLTSELDGKAEASRQAIEMPSGSSFKIPEPESKAGFSLAYVRSGNGGKLKVGDRIKVNLDTTLVYVWESLPRFVVTLEGEGIATTKEEVILGGSYTVPSKTREGHTLDKIAGAEKEYNPGDKIENITSDLTLVYSWNVNHHNVRVLDGEELVKEEICDYGSFYTMPERNPAVGQHCACYTDADGNSYPAGQPIKVTSDLVLTYKWEINHYNVHIISGDANIPDEQVEHGGTYEPKERTWKGHTFLGITDGDGHQHEVGASITVTSDITLTYNWQINRYSVHIISGDDEIPDAMVEYGRTFTPEKRARSGYFLQNITDGDGQPHEIGVPISITSDLTLIYHWKKFKIGDIGPAGGMIFYVDEEDIYPDWDYLETSTGKEGIGYYWFGSYFVDGSPQKVGTETGIGTGKRNTEKLVAAMGRTAWDGDGNRNISEYAAKMAADYEQNGYDDWFLPSKDELDLVYQNLQTTGLSHFFGSCCYSSSEHDKLGYIWVSYFGDEDQNENGCCVRPVRAF